MTNPTDERPLLRVTDLSVRFDTGRRRVEAVRNATFEVAAGEVVGIVGESGCGKSVTARAILNLIDPPGRVVSGSVEFRGADLLSMSERDLRGVRGGQIAMVFQDPMSSLNPVLTIGRQLDDIMRAHSAMNVGERTTRSLELMRRVGIAAGERRLDQYPHELSGGMRQRVMIAMALANRPALVIADEPTTALDVTIQAQILELLREINHHDGTAILIISHNLGVIAEIAQRALVFYAGKVVEQGPTADVFGSPAHPYTAALLRSVPSLSRAPLVGIEGAPPSLSPPPSGCAFAARCPVRVQQCSIQPSLVVRGARSAACWVTQPPSVAMTTPLSQGRTSDA